MKKIVGLFLIGFLCIGIGSISSQEQEEKGKFYYEWSTNIIDSAEKAVEEEKLLFVYFAGSDWCPHCMRYEKEVLGSPIFRRYLNENFEPILLDSPRYREISEEQIAYTQSKLTEYEIEGFPTIVIMNTDAEEIARLGYGGGGANKFIKEIKSLIK